MKITIRKVFYDKLSLWLRYIFAFGIFMLLTVPLFTTCIEAKTMEQRYMEDLSRDYAFKASGGIVTPLSKSQQNEMLKIIKEHAKNKINFDFPANITIGEQVHSTSEDDVVVYIYLDEEEIGRGYFDKSIVEEGIANLVKLSIDEKVINNKLIKPFEKKAINVFQTQLKTDLKNTYTSTYNIDIEVDESKLYIDIHDEYTYYVVFRNIDLKSGSGEIFKIKSRNKNKNEDLKFTGEQIGIMLETVREFNKAHLADNIGECEIILYNSSQTCDLIYENITIYIEYDGNILGYALQGLDKDSRIDFIITEEEKEELIKLSKKEIKNRLNVNMPNDMSGKIYDIKRIINDDNKNTYEIEIELTNENAKAKIKFIYGGPTKKTTELSSIYIKESVKDLNGFGIGLKTKTDIFQKKAKTMMMQQLGFILPKEKVINDISLTYNAKDNITGISLEWSNKITEEPYSFSNEVPKYLASFSNVDFLKSSGDITQLGQYTRYTYKNGEPQFSKEEKAYMLSEAEKYAENLNINIKFSYVGGVFSTEKDIGILFLFSENDTGKGNIGEICITNTGKVLYFNKSRPWLNNEHKMIKAGLLIEYPVLW